MWEGSAFGPFQRPRCVCRLLGADCPLCVLHVATHSVPAHQLCHCFFRGRCAPCTHSPALPSPLKDMVLHSRWPVALYLPGTARLGVASALMGLPSQRSAGEIRVFHFGMRDDKVCSVGPPLGRNCCLMVLSFLQVLATNEFSSARKRMSCVVRFPDGSIKVLCKGCVRVCMCVWVQVFVHARACARARVCARACMPVRATAGLRHVVCVHHEMGSGNQGFLFFFCVSPPPLHARQGMLMGRSFKPPQGWWSFRT